MSYATVAQVRDYLDISSTADDALLTALISRARIIIDRLTGMTFAVPTDATRYVAVEYARGDTLWLPPRWMLAQPPTTVALPNATTIPISAIRLQPPDPPHVALRLTDPAYTWQQGGAGDIAITGRWGWSVMPPDDIVHATIRLTAWLYRQRSASGEGDRPTVADGGLVVLPMRLPRDIETLLSRYMVTL